MQNQNLTLYLLVSILLVVGTPVVDSTVTTLKDFRSAVSNSRK